MNQKVLRFFLQVFLLFNCATAFAQSWDVGVFAGGAGYMGDLNPVKPYTINNAAAGLFVKRNFNGYWAVKFSILLGRISAADSLSDNEQQKMRNLSFFSPVTELGLQTEFNFFNYIPSLSPKRYTPYLFAGAGLVLFNPKTRYTGTDGKVHTVELNPLATEGQDMDNPYRKYAITVPYGAGIRYNIRGAWSIGAEVGYRTAFTDYLDDVSHRYPDLSDLDRSVPINALRIALSDRSPEKGYPANAPYSQRGDFRRFDTYFFAGFTLTYTFLSRKCPPVM